jgi:hypothetical protein
MFFSARIGCGIRKMFATQAASNQAADFSDAGTIGICTGNAGLFVLTALVKSSMSSCCRSRIAGSSRSSGVSNNRNSASLQPSNRLPLRADNGTEKMSPTAIGNTQ